VLSTVRVRPPLPYLRAHRGPSFFYALKYGLESTRIFTADIDSSLFFSRLFRENQFSCLNRLKNKLAGDGILRRSLRRLLVFRPLVESFFLWIERSSIQDPALNQNSVRFRAAVNRSLIWFTAAFNSSRITHYALRFW
jgi:hypothetical protein